MPIYRTIFTFAVIGVLAVSPAMAASAAEPVWNSPVTLSDAGRQASEPQLVTNGSMITAVWTRDDGSTPRIQSAVSTDAGLTWSEPVSLSSVGLYGAKPQVASDGTTVTVVWEADNTVTTGIQSASSADGGVTWSAPVAVSDASRNAAVPQVVATDDGMFIAVWRRFNGTANIIQSAVSSNGGVTWSEPANLSYDAGGVTSQDPQVVTDGSAVTAIWTHFDGADARVQSAFSADGGVTWGGPITLPGGEGENAYKSQLTTDGDTLTAVWHATTASAARVRSASSTDNGATWGDPVTLSLDGQYGYNAQVVTTGTTITAVWYSNVSSIDRIQTASSSDGGATWTDAVPLSYGETSARGAQLVTDGSIITIVWHTYSGSDDRVQSTFSTDGAATWSAAVTLSTAGQNAYDAQLATDGNTVTALWRAYDGENDRIQASSLTRTPEGEEPDTETETGPETVDETAAAEPELAATGSAGALSMGLLAAGLLATGAVLAGMRRRARV